MVVLQTELISHFHFKKVEGTKKSLQLSGINHVLGNTHCTCSGSDTQSVEQIVHVVGKIKEQLY
jgi:hypothetical protein